MHSVQPIKDSKVLQVHRELIIKDLGLVKCQENINRIGRAVEIATHDPTQIRFSGDNSWHVRSQSSNSVYHVQLPFDCTCPDRHNPCKHVQAVMIWRELNHDWLWIERRIVEGNAIEVATLEAEDKYYIDNFDAWIEDNLREHARHVHENTNFQSHKEFTR